VTSIASNPEVLVRRIGAAFNAPLARSVIAGVVVGVVSVLFYLSYAALIFSGPLSVWLPYGLSATFITGAVGGAITSLRSSLRFTIGGPDGATCAVIAALVATLTTRLGAIGANEYLLSMTLVLLALSAVLTGFLLIGLGVARLGRAIRFIPFPVIGGFLGSTGCLLLTGAVKSLTGYSLNYVNRDNFLHSDAAEKLLAGAAVAAFLLVGRKYWKSPLAMPVLLLISAAIFYAVLLLFGISLTDAQAGGWTFNVPSTRAYSPPWTLDLVRLPWSALPELGADIVALMFVGTISILLNITAIEIGTKREANLDRELRVQGGANLLCAALGGYVSCFTNTRTRLNFVLGGDSRIAGLIVAALSAALMFLDPGFLDYAPKCILGGLLVTIGYDAIQRWLIASARQLARLEYVSLLAIVLIIVLWGFLPGVAIGVIFGCATFALSAGRINAIKFPFDGSEYRSSLDRGPREHALLSAHGRELLGLRLQSYLFFGSANRLYENVKVLLAERTDCRFLLFDFTLVTGIDSSAIHSFGQIKQAADALGARLVLVNLSLALAKTFRDGNFLSGDIMVVPDLDRALETCENAIIDAHSGAGGEVRSLREWLRDVLHNAAYADMLAAQCRRLEFAPDQVIASQGGPSDSMHFIVDGRVGIIVNLGEGRSIRVRSLGPHTTIGEMGLLTGRPRSATVQAEIASIVYELPADVFERFKAEQPMLVQALLIYIIDVMAERLSFASRVIGVLQR
jgi:sulfate permease, SulP family